MEAVKLSSVLSFHLATNSPTFHRSRIETPPVFNRLPFNGRLAFSPLSSMPPVRVRVSSSASSEIAEPPEPAFEVPKGEEKYDWYAQWYPLMPVCDLDKRIPHAKRVMGIDVVIWWDRNENAWKVFDDHCPHRLAPLSEGRIDQWGRLQCVYHGWCFNGSGDCKFIPQAPPDGPPVNTSKKACTSVYPSTVQNDIVWFWPNSDPQYKDILTKENPPFIPEIDDPSYTKMFGNREINYGYELLIENLMDPAHLPYAHYGIINVPKPKEKADREGGIPLDISLLKSDITGFLARQDGEYSQFIAPCVLYFYSPLPGANKTVERSSASGVSNNRVILIFLCIPVSPGKSRLIWTFPRNFVLWIDKIVPRWVFHVGQNLVLDSDLYLLHVQEYKIKDIGPTNWHKSYFVPTKSDALVIAFRRWLNKYSNGEVDWRGKFSGGPLLPSPPREQLMDRYWTHVVNCSSCRVAHKGLNNLEVTLQVASIVSLAIAASVEQDAMSTATRNILVITAVLCFVGSKWLSHFVYKTFRYHDYYHALRERKRKESWFGRLSSVLCICICMSDSYCQVCRIHIVKEHILSSPII